MSTEGPFVTKAQRENLYIVKQDESAELLCNIISKSNIELNEIQQKVECFVREELPESWDDIVKQYNSYILGKYEQ